MDERHRKHSRRSHSVARPDNGGGCAALIIQLLTAPSLLPHVTANLRSLHRVGQHVQMLNEELRARTPARSSQTPRPPTHPPARSSVIFFSF